MKTDKERGIAVRKEVNSKNAESAVIIAFFPIQDNVEDFFLGELSGSLKNFLSLAQKKIKFTFELKPVNENNKRYFKLVVVLDSKDMLDNILQVTQESESRNWSFDSIVYSNNWFP